MVYSLSEWNGCVIHVWVYLQVQNDSLARDLFSEKSLTQFRCVMQQSYRYLPMLPFCCLLPFVSFYLCDQGSILGDANKKQSPWVPFFQRCHRHPSRVSLLVFAWFCVRSQTKFILKLPENVTLSRPATFRIFAPEQPNRTCNSGAESSRELFKGSKDTANLLVCTKKNFWLGDADFLWVTS